MELSAVNGAVVLLVAMWVAIVVVVKIAQSPGEGES